jgi:phosphotransferase system HPr (HPr) family protein
MNVVDRNIVITHAVGLHARPAAEFVGLASKFPCDIQLRNLTRESRTVNAKSMLMVLSLGVSSGHEVQISADGEQEAEALQALVDLIERNFGE